MIRKRSGEQSTIRARPLRTSANARAVAPASIPEAIIAAGCPPSTSRRY